MDVNDLLVFVRVAQAGSFTRAAQLMQMPVSTVSRRVAQLEDELGIPLLVRTTRSLRVTDVGRAYLEHGRAIATELERAETLATNLQSIPQGTLRLTATADFGNFYLGAIVSEFLRRHPQVQMDVVLTERVVDLVEEGFDLAIRMGELDDSSLKSKRIGTLDLQLFASPAFIKQHGVPRRCADLAKFACLRFTGEDDGGEWRLQGSRGSGESQVIPINGRARANDMVLIREYAIAGLGIGLMPRFLCEGALREGQLVRLLSDWAHSSGPIHVVFPAQRHALPKVRAFLDLLGEQEKI